jgi:hypothetical protein
MKDLFSKNTRRTITLILLGFFVFSFLHSELGFINCDTNNHGTHDYCQIVKYTDAQSKILPNTLPRLERNKDLCVHCFKEVEVNVTKTYFERTDHHLKAKASTDLYLFNNTFLI